MDLDLLTEFTVFLQGKLSFALNVHVDLVPVCGVVLILTDGTN